MDKTYISLTEYGFQLINKEIPLCDYKKNLHEISLVCKFFKLNMPKLTWNGIESKWVSTNTIEEV